MLVERAEEGAPRQAGWIPPGGRRVVGHRDEGTRHPLRTGADRFIQLRRRRRRARENERRHEYGADRTSNPHMGCYREKRGEVWGGRTATNARRSRSRPSTARFVQGV